MTTPELGDGPLSEPEDDLLGVVPHAETLAKFLEHTTLPFTLGVYGAWGEGKTTFVRFLAHYLRRCPGWKDLRFVEFSAWPYVTADAIWRALLERLASEIYQYSPQPVEEPVGMVARMRRFLHREVVALGGQDDARERYERLMRRVDRTAAVATRTGRDLSALAGVALDATGSGAVGPLRRLLGLTERRLDEDAARQVAESVEEIRRELREMFGRLVPSTRIVLLLDDLDRCLPEVALDVLETIKIFLFESSGVAANCLFVVAADEALIGRGLRARLGEDWQARLYLEKVVQLGVVVPRVEVAQVGRLMAANCPEWTLAADIIAASVGTNPRRIKQLCNVLSYRHLAANVGTDSELVRAFDGAVRSHALSPNTATGTRPNPRPVLLGMADATVTDGRIRCADPVAEGVFRYIGKKVAPVSVESMRSMYVRRLINLAERVPELLSDLQTFEGSPKYVDAVAAVDAWADANGDKEWSVPDVGPPGEDEVGILREEPRISEVPHEFVHSFPLNRVVEALRRGVSEYLGPERLVGRILRDMPEDSETPERLEIATEVLARRKFAKVQALEAGWPELVGLMLMPAGPRRLRELERSVRDPEQEIRLPASWEEFAADERLLEFLRTPPYFEDILPVELATILPASAVSALAVEIDPYTAVRLSLNLSLLEKDIATVEAVLHVPNGPTFQHTVTLPYEKLISLVDALGRAYQTFPTRELLVAGDSPEELLDTLGSLLWSSAFEGTDLGTRLLAVLDGSDRVRLVITTDDPRLAGLPWECLKLPTLRVHSGLTLKISVVRELSEPAKLARRSLHGPLRILVVAANPAEARLPGLSAEIGIVRQVLEPVVRSGAVVLEILSNATVAHLEQTLRRFRPHVFHFMGHGTIRDGGSLVLVDDDGRMTHASTTDMGTLLQDHGVLLAVLNACATGGTTVENLADGVGQHLVRQGIAAAVATSRDVLDHAALAFARTFYGALVDGYPLEPALVEAKKALSVRKWDWSAYVLYATSDAPLDDLRIRTAG